MSQWLLLVNDEETNAQAIEIMPHHWGDGIFSDFKQGASNPDRTSFSIFLYSRGGGLYKNNALQTSAINGAEFGYELLWNEKALKNTSGDYHFEASAHFDLETAPQSVTGKSADLLFALAVVTAALPCEGGYPHYAATGRLDHPAGAVYRVNGIPAKVDAAMAVLKNKPGDKYIFIPKENDGDVSAEIRKKANRLGIEICALDWFDEALEKLKVPLHIHFGNPYRGLQSFGYQQRGVYFGREREALELAQRLVDLENSGTTPVLPLLAPSGAGKTSFIHAGLRPALENLNPLSKRRWLFKNWTPSMAPKTGDSKEAKVNASALLEHLRVSFLPPDLAANPDVAQALQQAEDFPALANAFATALPSDCRLVWMIDQAEELFTQYDAAALQGFIALLQTLHEAGIWLLISLRNDFYPQYQAHLQELCNLSHEWRKLDADALDTIIQKPASLARRPPIRFETISEHQSLATLLRKDMQTASGQGGDALPLLQFALDELYCRSETRHKAEMAINPEQPQKRPRYLELTQADYDATGGLFGAIGKKAEETYQKQSSAAQEALPKLLWDLVTFREGQDFSAQAAGLAGYPEGGAGRELIDAFADPEVRLLVCDEDKVRVAHEALFRHWETAADILKNLREYMAVRERVRHDYEIWCANGKADDLLLMPGKRLNEGSSLLEHKGDMLVSDGREEEFITYINLSIEAEQKRKAEELARQQDEYTARQRRKLTYYGFAAFVIILALAFTLYFTHQSEQAAVSGKLVAEANSYLFKKDYAKAEILAAKAITISNDNNAGVMRDLLLKARTAGTKLVANYLQDHPQATLSQFSRDGQLVAMVIDNSLSPVASLDKPDWLSNAIDYLLSIVPRRSKYTNYSIEWNNSRIELPKNHSAESIAVYVRSISDGTRQWRIELSPSEGMPDSMMFNDEGDENRLLAIAHSDHHVSIWSLESGKPAVLWRDLKMDDHRCAHTKRVPSMAFHPSKAWIATSSEDQKLCLWDYSKQTVQLIWEQEHAHDTAVHGIAFNRDGSLLASGGGDYLAKIWKIEDIALGYNGQKANPSHKIDPVKILRGHTDSVFSVAFSPDGEWFASGGYDRVIRVWKLNLTDDTGNIQAIRTLNGHEGTVMDLMFSNDNKMLVSGGKDQAARVWVVKEGRMLASFTPENGIVRSVAWRGFNDDLRIGGEHGWSTWSLSGNKLMTRLWNGGATVGAIAFDPVGQFLAAAGDDGKVRIWDNSYNTPLELDSGLEGESINGLAISPDGQWLAAGGEGKTIHIWKRGNGWRSWEKLQTNDNNPLTHTGAIWGLCFDEKGRWLFSGNTDGKRQIKRWKVGDFSLLNETDDLKHSVYTLGCDIERNRLVSGDSNGTVKVWDAEHLTLKEEIRNVKNEESNVWSVALSHNPARIFSGNSDGHVYRWLPSDPEWTGLEKEDKLKTSDEAAKVNPTINSISFDSKRGWLAAGGDGNKIEIYDADLNLVQSIEGHEGTVWYVAFDLQGSRLAYGGSDRVLRVITLDKIQNITSGSPEILYQEAQQATGFSVVEKPE